MRHLSMDVRRFRRPRSVATLLVVLALLGFASVAGVVGGLDVGPLSAWSE